MHWNRVREANYILPAVKLEARLVRGRIQRTRREIPTNIMFKFQIGQRLTNVYQDIGRLEAKLNDLYEVTNICMRQYEDTENENTRNAEAFLS